MGCDVVVHALNPLITHWHKHGAAARLFGDRMPPRPPARRCCFPAMSTITAPACRTSSIETTPMRPTTRKGRNPRRDRAAHARGVRARHAHHHPARRRFLRRRARLVVRSGDHEGARSRPASPIRARSMSCMPGRICPILAAAAVRLAAVRDRLGPFETFGFPGHAVTGREFVDAIAKASGDATTSRSSACAGG